MGPDFSSGIGAVAISAVSTDPSSGSFNLDDLNKHNAIEHDASLSRSDYYVSPTHDNYDFNASIFNQVLAFYQGLDETSIDVAAKAKYARLEYEMTEDRNLTYGAMQFVLSYGESALYLSTMGDPVTGVAPVEFVRVLFGEWLMCFEVGVFVLLANVVDRAGEIAISRGLETVGSRDEFEFFDSDDTGVV